MTRPAGAPDPQEYCSVVSTQAGEDLFATATRTDVYLLLEYNGAWESKAFEASSLLPEVKAHLSAALKAIPRSRLLLVKSRSGLLAAGISFFLADTRQGSTALYAYHFDHYEDLLSLDIPAALANPAGELVHAAPLFLICTNGRRDICCARHGQPAFVEAQKLGDAPVWQTTHVGGHRFAANLVCLPHGLFYGRLAPGDPAPVMEAYRQGQIYLGKYRGRCSFSEPVQAADYFLRLKTGALGIDAFRLAAERQLAGERWEVDFQSAESGALHRLRLWRETTSTLIAQSCQPGDLSPVVHFHLEGYERVLAAAPPTT